MKKTTNKKIKSNKAFIDRLKESLKSDQKYLLEVDSMNKTFYSGKNVVKANNNVSFNIKKGEVVGLIGESGSGKTTIGRNIINLHTPESGSILLDGKEITGKRLNKGQRKHLYNNVQMIFQDPYSSLNGQKNIMSIVSESLKAKKLDKKLFDEYTKNQKQVLFYFEYRLKEFYYKKLWEYKIHEKKVALSHFKKIDKSLSNFYINEDKTMEKNLESLITVDFDVKEEANYKIITKLDDFIESIIKEWTNKQDIVENLSFENKLHNEIRTLTLEIEELKKSQGKSVEEMELEEQLTSYKSLYKELVEKNKFDDAKYFANIKSIKSDLSFKISNQKNVLAETNSIKKYNIERLSLEFEMSKLFAVKKILKLKKHIDAKDLLANIEKLYKPLTDVPEERYVKTRYVPLVNVDEVIIDAAAKVKELTQGHEDAQELSELISLLSKKLSAVKGTIKEKDLIKQHKVIAQLSQELSLKDAEYKEDLSKLKEKINARIQKYVEKMESKFETLSLEVEELHDEVEKQEKLIFKNIIETKEFDASHHKDVKTALKHAKRIYRREVFNNNKLELEISVNMKTLRVIQQLYGINSKNNVLFKKTKLKNVFTRQEVFNTLVKVGLNKAVSYRYPHEFSGGMRQRVGIARALISQPKLIIADEPIAALDLSIQAQIVNLLLDLKNKEGISLLFVAHDLSMVEHNSDRVVIMHLGRIVEYGETTEVFKNPVHPYTKNLMDSIPSFTDLSKKFVDNKFVPEYLGDYQGFTKPTYHKVSKDHFILASDKQFKKWKK